MRKPGDYVAERPGDLVQVDTLDVRPFLWMALKQFTARGVISKWDVIEARRRAAATTAKEFLETLEQRMPFKVKAFQVDGGRSSIRTLRRNVGGERFGSLFYRPRVQDSMVVSRRPIGLIRRSFMRSTNIRGT